MIISIKCNFPKMLKSLRLKAMLPVIIHIINDAISIRFLSIFKLYKVSPVFIIIKLLIKNSNRVALLVMKNCPHKNIDDINSSIIKNPPNYKLNSKLLYYQIQYSTQNL